MKRPFISMSYKGTPINFKCYKQKAPFRTLCDRNPIEDCWRCRYFKGEMNASDIVRMMGMEEAVKKVSPGRSKADV